jgi:hypothetical protein
MQFEIAQSVVPGHYDAVFLGVETLTNEYGQGLRWRFKIVGGPSSGEIVTRVTRADPTPANSAGRILAGLLGQPLSSGGTFDSDEAVGRCFRIEVCEAPKGGIRVEHVLGPAAPVPGSTTPPAPSPIPEVTDVCVPPLPPNPRQPQAAFTSPRSPGQPPGVSSEPGPATG